jgi:hypothetical protein
MRLNCLGCDVAPKRSAFHRIVALFTLFLVTISACGGSASELTPKLAGKRLDVAKSDLRAAGIESENVEVVGGGTFGALDESNWLVCDQEPEAGVEISDNPRLLIERECGPGDTFEAVASSPPPAGPESEPASPAAQPSPSPSPEGPPPEVKVDRCIKDGIEVIASGTIRNLDNVARTFAVSIEFYDKGGAKIEEGIDFIPVEAGQTARWQQDNFTEREYTLGDCKVVGVS